MNPHASTTNKDKLKNKAFMMVKHNKKLKDKKKRSFRDKQVHKYYSLYLLVSTFRYFND